VVIPRVGAIISFSLLPGFTPKEPTGSTSDERFEDLRRQFKAYLTPLFPSVEFQVKSDFSVYM
jgi:hypothetical protein